MHDIREHKTLEEVIQKVICWEDMDQSAIVNHDGEGDFWVAKYWRMEGQVAPTLLEAFYLEYGPHCYCDGEY